MVYTCLFTSFLFRLLRFIFYLSTLSFYHIITTNPLAVRMLSLYLNFSGLLETLGLSSSFEFWQWSQKRSSAHTFFLVVGIASQCLNPKHSPICLFLYCAFLKKKEDFITWDIEKPNRTIFWFGLVDEC